MTAKSALVTVLLFALALAATGALAGATIGKLAPEYYRSVFRHGDAPDFDPFQVGIGLGATQGFASGVAISIVVLGLLAWRDIRIAGLSTGKACAGSALEPRRWSIHAVWGLLSITSVIFVAAVTFALGSIIGQQQLYQSWTDRKLDKLAAILQADDFNGVEADYSSAAQVYLTGTIKDSAMRDALRHQLGVTFGTDEADAMIWRVDVAQ